MVGFIELNYHKYIVGNNNLIRESDVRKILGEVLIVSMINYLEKYDILMLR